ncbi:MAG: Acyl carrier protein [Pedosphaera sp.]|nr:Acyl carrier protein [Pedosphaera sp.]
MRQSANTVEQSTQKLELLDLLLHEEGISGIDKQEISRRSKLDDFPLSFAQKRLWFLDQLEPGPHYNDHFNLRFQGPLDISVLQKSLDVIVRRHEVLRASFAIRNGEPIQTISTQFNLELPFEDLSSLSEHERKDKTLQIAVEAGRMPFNLQTGPLLRAKLLRLNAGEHLLIFTVHHIAMDGWSRGVFLRELTALYQTFLAGRPSPLPAMPIQYADFAAWQQQQVEDEALLKQLAYWKQQLAGAPALLELPTAFSRPAVQSFRGARQTVSISKAITEALKALSQREGCTLFMTLLAAFQTLAHRYTGQDDILVGSPIANRNHAEIEPLIGCFLNTLVLRINLSGNPAFREVMSRVRNTALAAYAHQDLPYEKLVEELHPVRDQSYSPIFQTMFVFQNTPAPIVQAGDLNITPFEIDSGTAKFDLMLNLEETVAGITGWIEYATDLFDAAAINRFCGHYKTLLEAIVADPDQTISQISILTASEPQQLNEWNNTRVDYPRTSCVHELFEAQAARTPDSMAVVCEGNELSYAELNARANQLAQHLQSLGVTASSLVAICVERSLEMVVAMLGTLKAGATYVPLDPALPKERLQFMLEDAEVAVVLTQESLLEAMQALTNPIDQARKTPTLVCLDSNTELADNSIAHNVLSHATAESLAYVIYTSGSTGKPKGVQISHRAVVNFLESMRREPGLTEQDTLLAVTTLSFDIAGLEIWLPLLVGARVVIATREVTMNGKALSNLMNRSNATLMQATPTTWRLLLESGWGGNPRLKILCGGEAWSEELAQQLLERCGSVWNMYGPTETTIWSAVSKVEHEQGIFIGRPIANTQFYVVDKNLQLVPVGVPGELCIGGDGLARGYLKRPELTAEKFLPNPFNNELGARIYKTGDLVRQRDDGQIEFLGRMDHQVKLRGFRIELGEIESVLRQHPNVREAVVVARAENSGDKRLLAYLVAKTEKKLVVEELREHLKTKLPEYMVPAVFITLDAFPLTANGKVNRKVLPAPDQNRPTLASNYAAPGSPMEKVLAEIWCKALRLEKVGVNDSFFDLGGHSLLMVQVHARFCEAASVNLSIVKMFQYPTISSLVKHLDQPSAENNSLQKVHDRARLQKQSFARQRQVTRK